MVGCWLLVVGCWLLVVGGWWLVVSPAPQKGGSRHDGGLANPKGWLVIYYSSHSPHCP
ncbi:hypothetical protein [Fischerella sp. FACHB-380]|uniref:hypothetical protein n=1 Tax=Fischerella sp. FACHB-380 TaxID=2692799 RepID=UPI000363A566|nr:hypothetical protein [Fischerella sp. FACHB-380]MBD2434021.1 hypothetical protein [Fischerella sp. FACHB-380]